MDSRSFSAASGRSIRSVHSYFVVNKCISPRLRNRYFLLRQLIGQWGIIALPEYGSRWIYPWMAMRLRNDRSLIDFQFFFHRFAATIQSLLRSRCHLVLAITLWRIEQSDLRRSQVRNNKYSRQILLLGGMVRFTFDRIDEIPVWGQLPVIIWPIVWQYCQLQVSPQ